VYTIPLLLYHTMIVSHKCRLCHSPGGLFLNRVSSQGNWTFHGHANSWTYDSQTGQFVDTTVHGRGNLLTRHFADMTVHGLWTIHGKTFHGQAGLFADKLFAVNTLYVAYSRRAGAHCTVAVPRTCTRHLILISYYLIVRLWTKLNFLLVKENVDLWK